MAANKRGFFEFKNMNTNIRDVAIISAGRLLASSNGAPLILLQKMI